MPLSDKPALSANQLSAVDPNLLERVKEIIKDAVTYSSDRLVDESSFSPSSSYRFSQEKRLPSPATYSRNSVSHLSNSVSSQEQVQNDNLSLLDMHNKFSKNASYDIGPGRSLPAFDHVKPENVANKCLDGWLPAPSGLKREGIAEKVTGQNCPQSLNERKSVGEGIQLKNLYDTGFDVKEREGSWNPRVQSCDDSSSTADKPPCFNLCSVKEFCRHWSETQQLEHQKAEGNSTSGEMRLPLSHSEGSLAVRPSHCSPLAEGINNSLGVRQQRFDVALPASGDDRCIFNSSYQAERPKSRPADLEYYAVSRTVRQDESNPSKSSALLSIEQYRSRNVACSAAVGLGAGRIHRDCKGTESETFERTWTFSKATSENFHSSGYDSTDLTGSRVRESSFDGRNLPNEVIVPSGKGFHTEDNRTETMTRHQHSNQQNVHDSDVQFFKRVDPAQKIDPVEARERSRVEFGEEMIRRAQTGLPKLEDTVLSGKMRSESQPGLPIYKDYNHCSWKLEKSDSDRKLSAEHGQLSKGVHATGLSYIEDRREMSNQDYERKSEDRSRLKKSKAVTDEFMRTKFLMEIERREKELWRPADYSCSPSNTVITSSHTRFAVSPFEDEQITWPAKHKPKEPSCDSIRLPAPSVALKNYKSEMVRSHSVKPSSDGVASSCMLRDEPARRDYITRDIREDRSWKADENTYVEVRDFSQRQPSGYCKAEPRKVTSENSMDARQDALTNEFCKRNTKEPSRLDERHSSATRDSSATDRTSTSTWDKPIPQAEIKDGFLNEERIAFWENLKAHLGDLFLKKQSPVTLQQLCSESKNSSQRKDDGKIKEGKIPEKKTTEMLDQLPVKRLATVQPPKERSLKRNEEAVNDGAQVKDQLPRKSEPTLRPRQTHTSNQSQTPRCQDKMERNDTSKQKTASLRSSEAVRKTDSEQKLTLKSPEVEEKPASNENQAGKKRKILNKDVKKTTGKQSLAKTSKQAVGDDFRCLETNQENNGFKGARKPRDLRNLLNSRPRHENWRRREIKCQKGECSVFLKNDSVCEEEDEEEELVVEVPGPSSDRTGDNTSVEIFDSGRRREIEELTGERRNANKRRVPERVREETDSEFHRKRFRFNRMTPARFMRGGYRNRGRRTFGQSSKDDGFKYRRFNGSVSYQGDFLDQRSDIVFDEFDCGSEQGPYPNTDLDHRPGHQEHWESDVEREYFQGDESDGRLRYLRRSMDRYSNPRDQHPNDEPNVQFEGGYTYRFSDDVDTRFDEECRDSDAKKLHRGNYENCGLSEGYRSIREARRGRERYSNSKSKRFNKEVYNACSNDDIQNCNREDCDDRYFNDYVRRRSCEKNIAPISDDDTEERYRENRNIRYSSDNADEHFRVEDTADYSDDDVRGQHEGSQFVRHATYSGRPRKGSAELRDMRAGEFEKLKEPKAFLKDLEQKELPEELAVGLKVTPEDDFYEDDYSWDRTDPGCREEIARDSDFADSRAWIDSRESDYEGEYHESVPLSPREDLYTRAKFGRPSSGNSFPTRPWKQTFLNKTVQWQPRFGFRRKFGFQPLQKKLVSPRKFQPKRKKLVSPQKFLRTPIPQFAGKSGRNIPEVSNSVQEAIKQVVTNLKNAEMVDPEADAALFDTLSRGERKQVMEIQQMTGIQCISAIVTAMRTLWEFEPNVVRTLGSLEPEEIKKLGDDG